MKKDKNEATIKFENFLDSINGLENGYFTNKEPIKNRYFFQVHDGWLPMLEELITKLIELGWNKQICQVKEKFGGLRFYINSATTDVHNLIGQYEEKSYEICEMCGEKGELRTGGWYRTLCEEHAKQEGYITC